MLRLCWERGVSASEWVGSRAPEGMSLVVSLAGGVEGRTLGFRSTCAAALPGEMIPRRGGRLASREGPVWRLRLTRCHFLRVVSSPRVVLLLALLFGEHPGLWVLGVLGTLALSCPSCGAEQEQDLALLG